jgi:hypothetical protein
MRAIVEDVMSVAARIRAKATTVQGRRCRRDHPIRVRLRLIEVDLSTSPC